VPCLRIPRPIFNRLGAGYKPARGIQSSPTNESGNESPARGTALPHFEPSRAGPPGSMTLEQLLSGISNAAPIPPSLSASEITGLDYDSRRIEPGFVFFAFPGAKVDGRNFAASAIERGAIAVVSELPAPDGWNAPWIQVEHGRAALAQAARNFYDSPDQRLAITGITGTNGKTTTAFITDEMLRSAGRTTALVGTIEYRLGTKRLPAVNTTPESLDLYRLFHELEGAGGTHVTMEVSSHALAVGRVQGMAFHTAVFTNLTRDHLDFHQTMESYFAAKSLLFRPSSGVAPKWAAINHDDGWGRKISTAPETRVLWYGLEEGATVRARDVKMNFEGVRFTVDSESGSFPVKSPLVGRMNVYNILAAVSAGLSYKLAPEVIARAVADCEAVPGRFERIRRGQPFLVVVDYAHTDDALRNVISVARELAPKRVITLFGCGGDRDRSKRPLMGMAAGGLSDFVVLTSDNPRSEDPLDIINDALVGLRRTDTPHAVEPDRGKAIRLALHEARPGDVVILAGKGHETYQIIGPKTLHFDDREVARAVLREMGCNSQ
jgi:UDP-N-acetylmuramoyl-L-alanyl-D-glutamate--2,6-diaminopimelate ligase